MVDERNREIFKDRLSGMTLRRIGEKHNVSGDRVRQILLKEERKFIGYPRIIAAQKKTIAGLQAQIEELCKILKEDANSVAQIPVAAEGDIWDLELSVRTINCIKNMGIRSLNDIEYLSEIHLLRYPNFGRKSLNELKEAARMHGVYLGRKANDILFRSCWDYQRSDMGVSAYIKLAKESSFDSEAA